MSLQKALHFAEVSTLVSLKSCIRWSHYALPPITVSRLFPESGLTVVSPWYPVIHCPPVHHSPQELVGELRTLFTCKGFSLQAVGEGMGGGLGTEAEACHPVLPKHRKHDSPGIS